MTKDPNPSLKILKREQQILDELRVQHSELQQKQALEIGMLDRAINQTWAKISSLISII